MKKLVLVIAFMFVSSTVWATTINLTFDTLPSAQEWDYYGNLGLQYNPIAEDTGYSVDGTTLSMNTMGLGDVNSTYSQQGIIDPSLPFTICASVRVLQNESSSGFWFGSFIGDEINAVHIYTDHVRYLTLPDFLLDGTVFHEYKYEHTPGVGSHFYVDNQLIGNAFPAFNGPDGQNQIGFGDGSSFPFSNGQAEIQKYTFIQNPIVRPVPEPTTVALLGIGLVGLAGAEVRRRRKNKAVDNS